MRSLIICCVSFLLISCGQQKEPGTKIDSQLKGYIPPKTRALAGISFDKIKQTGFYQRHQSQLSIPMLDLFSQQSGIDPRKDLSTLLLAWDGTQVLGMIHGDFQPGTLERRLDSTTRSEKFHDLQLYGDGQRDVVFLPKGIALFGPATLLKSAVTDKSAGDDVIGEDLQLQLARINSAAQVWAASSGVIPLNQIPVRSDTATMLSNLLGYINGTASGITFGSGANLDAHIFCISEEGAQRVHDALRGVIGIARLNTPDGNPDQLKLWDSIHVDKDVKQVHVTADLTPELADRLISFISPGARRL